LAVIFITYGIKKANIVSKFKDILDT
jgi:hypothetical protein